MFTTIIAFDVMRRTQRKLKPCVIPEHENLAERYGIRFVFGSSTGNRITSFRLRRLVPRVLRLLSLDTKFSIELLF